MKALFTLPPATKQFLVSLSLISVVTLSLPHLSLAADLQANGQDKLLVFEVKNSNTKIQEDQTLSVNFDELVKSDPLVLKLKAYLEENDSPLAVYADQIVRQPQWERALAISFVESNLGQHCYDNNCSGIGVAPGHPSWRKYATKMDWFADLNQLLEKPIYKDKYVTFRQMKGIYVYPGSENWVNGAQHTYNELKALEQQAREERLALANTSNTQVEAAFYEAPTLAQIK